MMSSVPACAKLDCGAVVVCLAYSRLDAWPMLSSPVPRERLKFKTDQFDLTVALENAESTHDETLGNEKL